MLTTCPSEYPEEWDLEELHRTVLTIFPTKLTREQLDEMTHRDALVEVLTDDAVSQYETKEESVGADNLREIERRVMLSMIDQHWREHLYEMDYLREGINLRAMGQKDPLSEWQREGFDMFEAMMGQIQDNFVAYVSHLQVAKVEEAPSAPSTSRMRYSSSDDTEQGAAALRAAAAGIPAEERMGEFAGAPGAARRRGRARGRRPSADAGEGREDTGTQRTVLLRERQEVQALPRSLSPAGTHARLHRRPRRPPRRASTRRGPISRWRPRASGLRELEETMSGQGFWDDPDAARSVSSEHARLSDDIGIVDSLDGQLSDLDTLAELAREEGDDSFEGELDAGVIELGVRLDELELRALFSGEYDERDAICTVNSGAGGTGRAGLDQHAAAHVPAVGGAARLRRRDRRGVARYRSGAQLRDVHGEGPLRVRAPHERARRTPSHPHLAVRRQRASPDRVRLVRRRARARSRPRRRRSTRPSCASTPTARRAPAAST